MCNATLFPDPDNPLTMMMRMRLKFGGLRNGRFERCGRCRLTREAPDGTAPESVPGGLRKKRPVFYAPVRCFTRNPALHALLTRDPQRSIHKRALACRPSAL